MPEETTCELLVMIGFGAWVPFAAFLGLAIRAWKQAESKLAEQNNP